MSDRRRLAVVLLLPEPVATEVQGLRRALGDPAMAWVAPHITLVPPVNVRAEVVPAACARLRTACSAVRGPLHLTLGPAASFLPIEPVVYLAVGGDRTDFDRLQQSLLSDPFDRPLHHDPWVPHATVAIRRDPERIPAALDALADYRVELEVGWAQVMEQQDDQTWAVLSDAAIGPLHVAGRGGLERTVHQHRHVDPEVAAATGWPTGPVADGQVVAVVRQDGQVVGARLGGRTWVEPAEAGTGIEEILDKLFGA